MNYKDYKRQIKLSKVLNKPLDEDYLKIHNFLNDRFTSLDIRTHEDYAGFTYYFKNDRFVFYTSVITLAISLNLLIAFRNIEFLWEYNNDFQYDFMVELINDYLGTEMSYYNVITRNGKDYEELFRYPKNIVSE